MNKHFIASFAAAASVANIAYAQFTVYNSIPTGSVQGVYTPGRDPAVTPANVTFTTMDDIVPIQGGADAVQLFWTARNNSASTGFVRFDFTFWLDDGTPVGPTGVFAPGTYFANPGAIGFNTVRNMTAGQFSLFNVTLPAGFLPLPPSGQRLWMGCTMSDQVGTNSPAASAAMIGTMQYGVQSPSVAGGVGTSTSTLFETDNGDANAFFNIANPVGGQFNFGTAANANLAYRIALAGSSIAGTINLNDTVGAMAVFRNVNVKVTQGTNVISSSFTTVFTGATAAFTIGVPSTATGPAEIEFDSSPYLKKKVAITLTGSNITGVVAALSNGDVTDNGEVDAVDIDTVIENFGQIFPGGTGLGVSDVDDNGEVDATDIDIVIANFGLLDD